MTNFESKVIAEIMARIIALEDQIKTITENYEKRMTYLERHVRTLEGMMPW